MPQTDKQGMCKYIATKDNVIFNPANYRIIKDEKNNRVIAIPDSARWESLTLHECGAQDHADLDYVFNEIIGFLGDPERAVLNYSYDLVQPPQYTHKEHKP